jgi:hypothetical protein
MHAAIVQQRVIQDIVAIMLVRVPVQEEEEEEEDTIQTTR